ncbi:MAG: glycosyltransferase family 4 protein [Bacteroidales bacterium]
MKPSPPYRVLIPFAKADLYGLERSVIETFDALRPEVAPRFVQAESHVRRRLPVVEELERRGLSFDLLPDGDGWPRIRRRKWEGKARQMALALLTANRYYAEAIKDSDALCIDGTYTAVFAIAAAARCRLTGKPVILQFHEWPSKPLPRIYNSLVTDCFHNTAQGRDVMLRVDSRARRKRHWITPPVVDVSTAASPSPLAGNGKKNVVFAGQVSLHKGVDFLIDAFKLVAQRHADAVLHIVGGCRDDFRPAFESMCEQSRLGERLKYWGFRPDSLSFLRDAYLSVQCTPPSRCLESFGRTVVEAMAFGVPTVTFGSGAVSETVAHGETGLVCAETPDTLAAGIDRFLSEPQFRHQCGRNALQKYREECSRAAVRATWLDVLESIIRKPRNTFQPDADTAKPSGACI